MALSGYSKESAAVSHYPAATSSESPTSRKAETPAAITSAKSARGRTLLHRPLTISLLTLASVLLIWWGITASHLVPALFLPAPDSVVHQFVHLLQVGYMGIPLWAHLATSLGRIGLAFLLAASIAVPLGIAAGLYPRVRAVVDPLVEFYRPIPPLAYLPLIVIWLGIGEGAKVTLIYLAIFAPVFIATVTGVRAVDQSKIRAAQSLGATGWQVIRHVVIPASLGQILTGLRIGLGVGWSTLVAAELIASTQGLGFMVQSAAQLLQTDVVVIGILIIALIALSVELGLRALQRKYVPWDQPH